MKEQVKSRIKNEDLKSVIPHLLEIHKLTFKNVPDYESTRTNPTSIRFVSSQNYLYALVSRTNCDFNSSYYFMEDIDSQPYHIFVDSKSFQPEFYFDLSSLIRTKQEEYTICDEWYYTISKYKNQNGKLILEKISTTFDNSCVDCFYDKSDSTFLNEIGILIPEPEPEPINSSK